jgi:hypothetical protein
MRRRETGWPVWGRMASSGRLGVFGGAAAVAVAVAVVAVVWAMTGDPGGPHPRLSGEGAGEEPEAAASATVTVPPTGGAGEPFAGTLNGIAIDPEWPGRTPYEVCPDVGLEPAHSAELLITLAAAGPLRIDPGLMPEGVTPTGVPEGFSCRDTLVEARWDFAVEPGTADANPGGGTVSVRRAVGKEPLQHGASAERWLATTIGAHPGVLLRAVVEEEGQQFGECLAAFYDSETDVLTTVIAVAANGAFCLRVAEAVARGDRPVFRRDGRFAPIRLKDTVFAYPIVDEFGAAGIEIFEAASEASIGWVPGRPYAIFQGRGEYDPATGGTVYDRGWNEIAGYLGQTDRLARLAAGLPYYDADEARPAGPPPTAPPGQGCSGPQCPTPTPPGQGP